ncbi:phage portal protein [uncultured Azohydromonas sp.]|jgi:phage portal protein, HK97 family|uniref:phage portal protein n=1 Tax=uncultured Azohydromonas sp. TaxID=487342 RepID=UPI00262851BD|nr:phage portal protein [uncultured Azohydromonas sp.]
MTRTFDLSARRHDSRVLGSWLASREGGAQRAGIQASAADENAVTTGLTAQQLVNVLGMSNTSAAGVAVTQDTAMRVSAVYGCVSLIAGAIAGLPLAIYERKGEEKSRASHEYWGMLNEQPCEEMCAYTAWEYLISAKLFGGDGFAKLLRPSRVSSRVIGWKPYHWQRVTPFKSDGELLYRVVEDDGSVNVLYSADMIHLTSLGFDGRTSPSPITYAAREAIGISLAGQSYNARFFSEGAAFDYALKSAGKLDDKQLAQLRESLALKYTGGPNSRLPLLLTGGVDVAQLTVNPKDAEVLATRLFSVQEICRILGVPPFMVAHTDKTTSWGTGIDSQGIGFVRYTLLRHLTQIRQEFNRKLWPGRGQYYAEHIVEALEKADLLTRFQAYRIAVGRAGEPGWMVPNEVRRRENMPPIEGGDKINTGAPDDAPASSPSPPGGKPPGV